ncbi:MAG: metallophosphoesterase [Bacillota bacterium]
MHNYLDLQIMNNTKYPYQLCINMTGKHLEGEWRALEQPEYLYEVYEREHRITHEIWGGYVRHNVIGRRVYGRKTGDILDRRGKLDDTGYVRFCKSLSDIAPAYAVTGNHEAKKNRLGEWERVLRRCGVIPMENRIEIFKKGSSGLALMGLEDGIGFLSLYFDGIEGAKDIPRVLLAHRPEFFYSYCSDSNEIRPDLVLSGHAHGGQFRIPFVDRGLVAPHQGLFPRYTSGLYASDNGVQMVVSRGLGNSIFPVRLNNRIHLPVIILAVAGVRAESKEGGENMIKNVYIYLVLFATLMMTIGGSVGVFMATADIVAPAYYYQSFEDYKRWGTEKQGVEGEKAEQPELTEEELRANYDAMVQQEKNRQIERAKNNLIKSFGWIAIPLPVFIYFQRRLVKKEG